MNVNMNKPLPKIFEKSTTKSSTKNKLISFSLMWMGVGVAIIFLMTYLVITTPSINRIINDIVSTRFGGPMLVILNLALILGISFFSQRLNLPSLILLYIVFIMVQGIFVSTTIYWSGFSAEVSNSKNIFLIFLIPSLIFVVMGLLGYFQVFDFSKLGPFLIFATIGLMIFSLFVVFFGGESSQKWYSLFGVVLFSLWIGFDVWWIQRTSDQIESSGGMDKQGIIKLGLVFGLRLFIDFVNVLMFLARLMR